MYEIEYERGIANRGNQARLKKVMDRAIRGEKLTIGFLGGSITQGSLSSKPTLCYAYRVFDWWKQTFPQAEFTYVNAGIGGTTSHFGAARVQSDLLAYEPDFVIVEYSVNDESNEHFEETYEGLVRTIYQSETKPAVVLVHNVFYHNGGNAQLIHSRIGRHYELPCVSMQSTIYPKVVAGEIENRQITPDDLHPNDQGHELVASVITYFLNTVRQAVEQTGVDETEPEAMPQPLTANSYEHTLRINRNNYKPDMDGFTEDESEQTDITDCFKNGWIANRKNARIFFSFEGSGVAIQYRKSVKKPACIAKVIVDGDPSTETILDANFDEDWGDKLELDTITEHMQTGTHTAELTIIEDDGGNAVPFYLTALIVAGGKLTESSQ